MSVDERIHMNDYFNDPRFQQKKPNMEGDWQQRCGDNFYQKQSDGLWLQYPNPFHTGLLEVDTRNPYVFVGREFWYLGRRRVTTPPEFMCMVGRRGARVNHPEYLVEKFMKWVRTTFKTGITALPLDAEQ